MASWSLVPCLRALRDEFNDLAPGRDKRSDGSVGDLAHQDRPSDHNPDETGETPYEDADSTNEVHAVDIDMSGPWPPGMSFDLAVKEVVDRHRRGLDDRLQNVIWNGRIASRTWGWTWREYTGSNGHHEHGHFSARYTSRQEADTSPWGVKIRFGDDNDMADITTDQMDQIADRAARKVWAYSLEDPTSETDPKRRLSAGNWLRYADHRRNQVLERVGKVLEQVEQGSALHAELAAIKALLEADAGGDPAELAEPATTAAPAAAAAAKGTPAKATKPAAAR